MKETLVILAHPNLETSTINRRWKEAIEQQLPNVEIRDLYSLYGQNFQIDVQAEQEACEQTERIVWQFPFYWYSCPPLLKKWFDDVLTDQWAYGKDGDRLHGKELLLAFSTGSGAERYHREGRNKYTVEELIFPFRATSNLIGTTFLPPYYFNGAYAATEEDIQTSIAHYMERLRM